MTSLLSRLSLTGAPGRRLTPNDMSKLISDAEKALKLLHDRYGPIAYAAQAGETDAKAELESLNRQIRESEDSLRSLNASLLEAERIEQLEQSIARENLFHSQRKAAEAHVVRAVAGAEEYAYCDRRCGYRVAEDGR